MNKIILVSVAFVFSSLTIQAQRSSSCKDLLQASKSNNATQVANALQKVHPDCVYRKIGEPRTSLVAAARNGSLEIVTLLVTAKASVNFQASGDESPLIAASAHNNLPVVLYLLKKGARVNTNLEGDGTALIAAVRNNNYQITKTLLEHGADPNMSSDGDEYPMYHAKMTGNKRIISLLNTYLNKSSK